MSYTKGRESNFELLRIVSIIMVVIYHIVLHCVNVQLTDSKYLEIYNNGYFNHPVFYPRLLVLVSCMPLGIVANTIFMLISGYFLIEKTKINVGKQAEKLLKQLFFSAVILMLFSLICYQELHYADAYISLRNLQNVNAMSWFVGYYFLVILVAALFLNNFLGKMDQRNYSGFLIIIYAVIQFAWTGSLLDGLANGMRVFLTGVFAYSFGGYIRRYCPLKKIRTYTLFLIILLAYLLIFISYYNDVLNNIQTNAANENFTQAISDWTNYHPIITVLAVCVFELFRRLRIGSHKVINFVGGSTLMIYLLHDNAFCYSIWDLKDWITSLWYTPIDFIGQLLLYTLVTFFAGLGIYCLYCMMPKIYRILSPILLYKR